MRNRFVMRRLTWWGVVFALWIAAPVLAQTGVANPPTGTSSTESFLEAFFLSRVTHANGEKSIDFIGTSLLWILLTLSMVNLGLIGYLTLMNQRKSIAPEGVVAEVKKLLAAGDYRQALELTRRDDSYFSTIMHSGLNEASHGFTAVMRTLEQKADLLITQRMRPIEILYMLGQVSPMMGLLGTVYGIIFAFKVFVSMGGHASPALLAGGIGTALVATFWGLVIAIPALAGYSLLRNKVDQLTMEATVTAEELLSQFKPKASAMPPGAAVPSAAKPPVTKPAVVATTGP